MILHTKHSEEKTPYVGFKTLEEKKKKVKSIYIVY